MFEKLTTQSFRSRCATCPERSLGSCLLAQAVLGEGYKPDNCDGPKVYIHSQPFGSVELQIVGMLTMSRAECSQDPMLVQGEVLNVVDLPPQP